MQIFVAKGNQRPIEVAAGVGGNDRVEKDHRVVEVRGYVELAFDGNRGREQSKVCSLFYSRVDAAAVEFQMQLFEAVPKPEQREPRLTKTPRDRPGRSAREDLNMCSARVNNGAGYEFAPHLSVFSL